MSIATDIGAYVGAAAFLGLLFIVPLYFSQARDIRRLRTWMLLTPDLAVAEQEAAEAARVAEEEAEAAERAPVVPPEPRPRPPAPPVPPVPAPDAEEPRPVPGLGPPTPVPGATSPAGVTPASGTTPSRPLTPAERIALDRPATARITAERAVVTPPAPTGFRRILRRPSERGLAGLVGAVLVLGIAVVFVVLQTGDEGTEEPRKAKESAVVPSDVEVAVLNGTAVPDLAARVGDDVEANGFVLGTVTNSESPFEETTVFYEPGSEDEGQEVAKALGATARVEPMDEEVRALAGGAPVVVIAGEDRAQ